MKISYSKTKEFDKKQLQDLFLSVQWSSGNYPDQLQTAMKNSHTVISAWDGDKLVGLINALSDGIMTAYFHYLLVHPDYQSQGIGKQLVTQIVKEYKDYARKVLIAYNKEVGFYQSCGFTIGEGKTPMFITYLTT
jgi:ribosomal protein S18 acetylase RimI-like enzyme